MKFLLGNFMLLRIIYIILFWIVYVIIMKVNLVINFIVGCVMFVCYLIRVFMGKVLRFYKRFKS